MRDGDVDSDIVWHEYGHGLTWRMIGKMSGPLAGAIGEGMSDVLALIANEDDIVGEYSTGDPFGIRSMPYDAYNRDLRRRRRLGGRAHATARCTPRSAGALLEIYQAARPRQERAARRPGGRHELHAEGAGLRGHA